MRILAIALVAITLSACAIDPSPIYDSPADPIPLGTLGMDLARVAMEAGRIF